MTDLGKGIYTLSEAARLVRTDARKIRRWLFGYDYTRRMGHERRQYRSEPLWRPEYGVDEFQESVIGFRDLMELRIVREFVARGVPLAVVRYCLAAARDLFGDDYPLTRQRFLTDGETIFHEALDQIASSEDGPALLDLKSRQHVFRTIMKDSLYGGIEYEGELARRWYPEGKSRPIVLDPKLQYGHPIILPASVPTSVLYAAWLSEGKKKSTVAKLYEVEPRYVELAVHFEEKQKWPRLVGQFFMGVNEGFCPAGLGGHCRRG